MPVVSIPLIVTSPHTHIPARTHKWLHGAAPGIMKRVLCPLTEKILDICVCQKGRQILI